MPRKLAFTGGHKIEIVEYQERPLRPHEVRVRTEFASGKHGTPLAIMSDRNDPGQCWDDYRAYDAIISMMRQGALTVPGLIQPLVVLDEGPAVWDLVVNEPEKVVKFGIRF